MAHDWTKPTTTSTKTNFPTEIRNGFLSLGKKDFSGDTNVPAGFIQFNSSIKKFQIYNGTSWTLLSLHDQDGSVLYGATTGGSANAQTVTLSPALTAYAAGQRIVFIPGASNTGPATLNVNGLGARNIYYLGFALVGGEIVQNVAASVLYDGTQWQLEQHGGGWATWTPSFASYAPMYYAATANISRYQRHGHRCVMVLHASGTTTGTPGNAVIFGAPIATVLLGTLLCGTGWIYDGFASTETALVGMVSSDTFSVSRYSGVNWNIGSNKQIAVQAIYEV